jgi:hypothetical protein
MPSPETVAIVAVLADVEAAKSRENFDVLLGYPIDF